MLQFQLDDHIPTIAIYQISIVSLLSETPTNDREPDYFQPRAQIKRLFEESILVSGDMEAIRKFSDKYVVPKKLVAEYSCRLSTLPR